MKKIRLDQHLINKGLAETRSRAQRAIEEGLIKVDGKIAVKASQMVKPDCSRCYWRNRNSFQGREQN